jgi:SAM-dependent methyltransferase
MNKNIEKIAVNNSSWFRSWFNSSLYHSLYANRDENEAAGFINTLVKELQPLPGSSMLDLGCGKGRHSKQLSTKGFHVTGIDLAASSIRMAKKYESPTLHFCRHDMRVAFGRNCFDYVFNFFTSFGYFQNNKENSKVVNNISQALKPGGTLLLDYINTGFAEDHFVPEEKKEIDGLVYHITRWHDSTHFYKKITTAGMNEEESHVERVAKLSVDDFEEIFRHNGLQLQALYGDYLLNEHNNKTSPRLILLAVKK